MNLVASHGARRTLGLVIKTGSKASITTAALNSATRPKAQRWICHECRSGTRLRYAALKITSNHSGIWRRHLSASVRLHEESRTRMNPTVTTTISEQAKLVDEASLPSQTDKRRWQISKRMAHMMDSILARASIAGQHINVYTGTDYSGIEALKKEIVEQEQKVREMHKSIDLARETHLNAHAQQDSSQKEIVGLLERKSSWTPADLERYMSLVRSEHTNDQAVQAANDGLAAAEKDLEEARSLLERLERKQYHEEQIWSDTIRRNSTWVTFGLMGLNIILLLAQIGLFEPYRRRKIVREVQKALDEKIIPPSPDLGRKIDEVVEPAGVSVEAVEGSGYMPEQPLDAIVPASADAAGTTGEVLLEESMKDTSRPVQTSPAHRVTKPSGWETYKENFRDLFSERVVELKKVDVTTTALQGAATGVAAMGLLFVLFRPR